MIPEGQGTELEAICAELEAIRAEPQPWRRRCGWA